MSRPFTNRRQKSKLNNTLNKYSEGRTSGDEAFDDTQDPYYEVLLDALSNKLSMYKHIICYKCILLFLGITASEDVVGIKCYFPGG